MAGRKGSPEGAPPPPSAKESARTDRADRRGPPRAGFRGGAPPANARSGEGAPRPRPRRGGADARAKDRPPAAVRTRANGRTPAGGADGRAGPSGPTRPTACRPQREGSARPDRPTACRPTNEARGPTDRLPTATRWLRASAPTDRLPTNERGARAERPTCDPDARSFLARCSLVPRSLRAARAAARSAARAPQGRRGAKPRTLPRG